MAFPDQEHATSGRGIAAVLASVFLIACGRRQAAESEVRRIGAENLAVSVEALRPPGNQVAVRMAVPEADWPATLRAIGPQTVTVGPQGVFVKLESAKAGESGVFIAFTGVSVPTGSGTDPSFEHLEGRIYWYRIKG